MTLLRQGYAGQAPLRAEELCGAVVVADCREWLPTLEAESVDACVTDPPYGIQFMGKDWDRAGVAFDPETWAAVLRVLKPGAHLLAFGGTRTYHRLVCAIEDAGFEVRDTICWLYGQGFPKSLDVSKALDKAAGAEREIVGHYQFPPDHPRPNKDLARWDERQREAAARTRVKVGGGDGNRLLSAPATPDAIRWSGWGTGLKPACELICLARKPLSERTVAANVLRWGTGAINVDGCRVPGKNGSGVWGSSNRTCQDGRTFNASPGGAEYRSERHNGGRWPANVAFDEEAAAALDEQSGERHSGGVGVVGATSRFGFGSQPGAAVGNWYRDNGGASRFFYCAKASRKERDAGVGRNMHPTLKPIALMRWLVRMVASPEGLVIDPFAGSGTTGIAAEAEGFRFLGCEQEAEYAEIAEARMRWWRPCFAEATQGSVECRQAALPLAEAGG